MAFDNEKNNMNKDVNKPASIQSNNIFNSDNADKPAKSSASGETKVVNRQRVVPQKSSRVKQVNLNVQTNDKLIEAESQKYIEGLQKEKAQKEAARKPRQQSSQGRSRVVKQQLPDSKPLKKSGAVSNQRINDFVASQNAASAPEKRKQEADKHYGYKKESAGETYVASKPNGRILAFSQAVLPYAGNELTKTDKINDRRVVIKRERKLLKIGADASREPFETSSVFEPEERTFGTIQKNAIQAAQAVAASNAAARLDQSTMRIPRPSEEMLRAGALESSKANDRIKKVDNFGNTQPIGVIPEGASDSVFPLPEEENQYGNAPVSHLKRIRVNDAPASKGKTRVRPWLKWVIMVIILIFCIAGFLFSRAVFDDAPMNQSDTTKYEFTVDDSTTDDTVADFLVEHGMVENSLFYKIRAKFFDAEYVPGNYEISPSYSTEKIINILSGFDYNSDSND